MNAPSSVRLFVVEDHAAMRQTLCDVLGAQHTIAGSAASAEDALARADDLASIDLALIDISLPGMGGIELVEQLRTLDSQVRCLVMSAHGDSTYAARALGAGACGYVIKGRPQDFFEAIDECVAGRTYLSEPLSVPPSRG